MNAVVNGMEIVEPYDILNEISTEETQKAS
jgi:hypothetical protein